MRLNIESLNDDFIDSKQFQMKSAEQLNYVQSDIFY